MKSPTPNKMGCELGISCPAVYELEDGSGRLVIVGSKLTAQESKLAHEAGMRCGPDEAIIIIDRAVLADVKWPA